MNEIEDAVDQYAQRIRYPVTKEELINGLLVEQAPGQLLAMIERLPRVRYEDRSQLLQDIGELTRVPVEAVRNAASYDEFLRLVQQHGGDIQHMNKQEYNRIVGDIIQAARDQGSLDDRAATSMEQRLDAAFASLRGSMSEVYDDNVPVNPAEDMPGQQE